MSRRLRRVPLGFDWPLNQVWAGFINPYRSVKCKACDGEGSSPEIKQLYVRWYGQDREDWVWINSGRRYNNAAWCYNLDADDVKALLDADRLWDFTRVPRTPEQQEISRQKIAAGGNSWLPEGNGYIPTPKEVNEWSHFGFGHDSINAMCVIRAKAERLGFETDCKACKGEGEFWQSPEIHAAHEAWKDIEPPTGPGWQLWEDTSEGSPVSPVFETAEGLAKWCERNATVFASERTSYANWLKMFLDDSTDTGTMCIGTSDYFGTVINRPTAT